MAERLVGPLPCLGLEDLCVLVIPAKEKSWPGIVAPTLVSLTLSSIILTCPCGCNPKAKRAAWLKFPAATQRITAAFQPS